jgi:8-oxo-dGTP pyrophosphatase MutT (NUDIX family)
MEKPQWRVRASSYAIDSPHMRMRVDSLVLPSGHAIDEYFVRESRGFVMVFPVTRSGEVVLVRQYRYPVDALTIELPAGTIDPGEAPEDCARRELLEETGFSCERLEALPTLFAESARSDARMHGFIAHGAVQTHEQRLDPSEALEWLLAPLDEVAAMLRDGRLDSLSSVALGYRALERLGYFEIARGRNIGRNASSEPNG